MSIGSVAKFEVYYEGSNLRKNYTFYLFSHNLNIFKNLHMYKSNMQIIEYILNYMKINKK